MATAYDAFEPLNRVDVQASCAAEIAETLIPPDVALHATPAGATSSTINEPASTQVPQTAAKSTLVSERETQGENLEGIQSTSRDQCTYVENTPLAAAAIESQLWTPSYPPPRATRSSPLDTRASKRRRVTVDHHELGDSDLQDAASRRTQDRTLPRPRSQAEAPSSSPIHYYSLSEPEDAVPPTVPDKPIEAIPATTDVEGPASPRPPQPATPGDPSTAPELPHKPLISAPFPEPQSAPALASSSPLLPQPANPAAPPPTAPTAPTAPRNPQVAATTPKQPHPFSHRRHPAIQGPTPPIALSPTPTPGSLITPSLTQMHTDPTLSTRYHPISQSRPIEPFERGYWRVDASGWRDEGQVGEFWGTLGKFMCSGRAGWGAWCTGWGCDNGGGGQGLNAGEAGREGGKGNRQDSGTRREIEKENEEQADDKGNGNTTETNVFRVYSWGATVPHIYLLLYVASKSRIKKCAVSWVDAGGEVVIRM